MSFLKNSYQQSVVLLFDKIYFLTVNILIARLLSIEFYGVYQTYILSASIISGVVGASLPYLASNIYRENKAQSLNHIFIIAFFVAIVVCTFIFSFIQFSSVPNHIDTKLLIALIFSQILFPISKQAYVLTNNIRSSIVVSFMIYPSLLILFLLYFTLNDGSYLAPLFLIVTVNFSVFILSYVNNVKSKKLNVHKFYYLLKSLDYKKLISITFVVGLGGVVENLDQIILMSQVSAEHFALYKVGTFRLPFIEITTGAIASVLIAKVPTWIKKNKIEELKVEWNRVIVTTTYFLIPIIVYCFVESRGVVTLLFGAQYTQSYLIYSLYTAKFFLASVTLIPVLVSMGFQSLWLKYLIPLGILEFFILSFILTLFEDETSVNLAYFSLVPLFFQYLFIFCQVRILKVHGNISMLKVFPVRFYFTVLFYSLLFCVMVMGSLRYLEFDTIFTVLIGAPIYYLITLLVIWKTHKNVQLL